MQTKLLQGTLLQKVSLITLLCLFVRSPYANAYTNKIDWLLPVQGTVVNGTTGEAVPGATVSIQGKTTTVATDVEGKFTINAEVGDVLIISSVGFTNFQLTITPAVSYSIRLTPSDASLTGITVIGSRGRPRTDVSRPVPVDVISSRELENTGQVDLGQMAQFTSPSFNPLKTASMA